MKDVEQTATHPTLTTHPNAVCVNINSKAIQYISSTAFQPINITTTWNALPYDVVNSRAVNIQESSRCAGQLVAQTEVKA